MSIDGAAVDRLAEKELYLRSFPRPASGAGPASVSSQSLWRNPMITKGKLKIKEKTKIAELN